MNIRIYGVYEGDLLEDDWWFVRAYRTLKEAEANARFYSEDSYRAGYAVDFVVKEIFVSPEMYDHLFNQMSYTLR